MQLGCLKERELGRETTDSSDRISKHECDVNPASVYSTLKSCPVDPMVQALSRSLEPAVATDVLCFRELTAGNRQSRYSRSTSASTRCKFLRAARRSSNASEASARSSLHLSSYDSLLASFSYVFLE